MARQYYKTSKGDYVGFDDDFRFVDEQGNPLGTDKVTQYGLPSRGYFTPTEVRRYTDQGLVSPFNPFSSRCINEG
jgi:hypothetical protein